MAHYIEPEWPAPSRVRAAITTRQGGASAAPYDSFNLGDHVGDDPLAVERNRARLAAELALPARPHWLTQVHGTTVAGLDGGPPPGCEADGVVATDRVCAILTADCLPVLLCDRAGTVVAAAHAGWRGLAAGVLRGTVTAMAVAPGSLMAYLGPAIGADHFEVGADVFDSFAATARSAGYSDQVMDCFRPVGADKWLADLYDLARLELGAAGVADIYGGDHCTYSQPDQFYSYRRDGVTGRLASLIWLEA